MITFILGDRLAGKLPAKYDAERILYDGYFSETQTKIEQRDDLHIIYF